MVGATGTNTSRHLFEQLLDNHQNEELFSCSVKKFHEIVPKYDRLEVVAVLDLEDAELKEFVNGHDKWCFKLPRSCVSEVLLRSREGW